MEDEGVIKYTQHFVQAPAPERKEVRELLTHRVLCREEKWIGALDDGTGFGNISAKSGNIESHQFYISGTQTGHIPILSPEHVTLVEKFSIEENTLWCKGPVKASSEAITHAAIYCCSSKIKAVIHIHAKELWEYFKFKVPTVGEDIPYGSPEMASAVSSLYTFGTLAEEKMLVMAGHEDGIISFGETMAEAMRVLWERQHQMRNMQ